MKRFVILGWKMVGLLAIVSMSVVTLTASTEAARKRKSKKRSVKQLMQVLEKPDDAVSRWDRVSALVELGDSGDPKALKFLIGVLDPGRRAEMFAGLRDTSAAMPAYFDDSWVQTAAAVGLLQGRTEKLTAEMLPLLQHENAQVRVHIVQALGVVDHEEVVAELTAAAKQDRSKLVRQTAVYELRHAALKNPGGPVTAALIDLARENAVAVAARQVLSMIRNPAAVPQLTQALSSPNMALRGLAADLLAHIGSPKPVAALAHLYRQEASHMIKGKALIALVVADLAGNGADETLAAALTTKKHIRPAVNALATALTVDHGTILTAKAKRFIVEHLISFLRSDDALTRIATAKALEKLYDASAVPPLISLVKKEDDRVARHAALRAIGAGLKTESHVQFLIDWLRQHPVDRKAVYEGIALIRSRAAIDVLLETLQFPDQSLHSAIRTALAALGSAKDVPGLLGYIENGPSAASAAQIAEVVGYFADRTALAPMSSMIVSGAPDPLVVSYVQVDRNQRFKYTAAVIGRMPAGKRDAVLDQNDFDLVFRVLENFPVIDGDETILLKALKVNDVELRRAALAKLGRVDSAAVQQAVCKELLKFGNNSLTRAATQTLSRYPSPRSIECMVKALDANQHTDEEMFNVILGNLWRMTGKKNFETPDQWKKWVKSGMGVGQNIDDYLSALEYADESVRIMAANRIAQLNNMQQLRSALLPVHRLLAEGASDAFVMALVPILQRIGSPASVPYLASVLKSSRSTRTLVRVATALSALGDSRGVRMLVQALKTTTPRNDRFLLMTALGMLTNQKHRYNQTGWQSWWRTTGVLGTPSKKTKKRRRRG